MTHKKTTANVIANIEKEHVQDNSLKTTMSKDDVHHISEGANHTTRNDNVTETVNEISEIKAEPTSVTDSDHQPTYTNFTVIQRTLIENEILRTDNG